MFRDRSGLYLSYRQSSAHHPSSAALFASSYSAHNNNPYSRSQPAGLGKNRTGPLEEDANPLLEETTGNDEDVTIEMDVLPPVWTDIDDEVTQILDQIQDKSSKLDKLHQEHVLPGFDDRTQQERLIETLTREITQHFHECQRLIQQLGTQASSGGLSRAQITMSKNMQISLATKVQEVSTAFRKKQSAYLKRLRGISAPDLPQSNSGYTALSQQIPDDELDVAFSQSQIQQSAQLAQTSDDTVIQSREAEINQIAEGIIELATIFRDLQTMVIDQGTVLDRIDYNIENVKTHVQEASKELVKASHYQKRTQKCKVILFLILLIFFLAIAVYIKLSNLNWNEQQPTFHHGKPILSMRPTHLHTRPTSSAIP
ncbi:t-SNARE [Lipomyces oligophaga]|uniref:t-SNARE n=1 Tax=Lipomyces oligophaga TaxID=45792 RepID=UPI0034CD213F